MIETETKMIILYTLSIIGIIALLALLIFYIFKRKKISEYFGNIILGQSLNTSIKSFLVESPTPSKTTVANIIAGIIYRLTRIGFLGFFIAIVPTILLYIQNQKIESQNRLIEKQNVRLVQQTHLQEAERRSSLIFLLSNVLDKLDSELKEETNTDRILSKELIGQISSLSIAFKPYRYLDGDTLTSKLLSPERGQLLLTLVNSDLNRGTLHTIYDQGNFQYSDLSKTTIHNPHFQAIDLSFSSFENTKLINTTFYETTMIESNFNNAKARGKTTIGGSDISGSTFINSTVSEKIIGDMIKIENIIIDNKDWLENYFLKEDSNDSFDKTKYFIESVKEGEYKVKRKST